jgi:hypothetical protein
MGNVAFLIAYVALPVASFLLVRSLTWITVALGAAIAFVGAFVDFMINRGIHWDLLSLQVALLVAMLAVFIAAAFVSRRSRPWPPVPFRRQMSSVLAPVILGFAFVLLSRLLAAPTAGAFTGVGFLVVRQSAEDNAKWLDFAGQLIPGTPIVQGVAMGGPLQLLMVLAATLLAVVSLIAFGGVNEVFVAANSVIYLEFALAMLAPFALAPLAEMRVRRASGDKGRAFIPAPVIWVSSLVLVVGSLAASGYGHLTLQYVFLVVGVWASLFLAGSRIPHAYLLTSLTVAIASIVWFPLTVVTIVILFGSAAYLVASAVRARRLSAVPWLSLGLVVAVVVMMWSSLASVLRYMADLPEATASAVAGFGGGAHAVVAGFPIPSLQLLSSQGGTEVIQPALGLLTVASAVLGAMFVARQRAGLSRLAKATPFVPLVLLVGYALALSIFGTWFAGSGPAYGANKSTFAFSIIVLAVTLPFALMEIDRRRGGLTAVRILAIVGVVYLLTIDTILPRAITYLSPEQWPTNVGDERGYWWPAEVRNTADQSIASNPIGCIYLPPGAEAPSALPEGQRTYSCTRILSGLSGEDAGGQVLVDLLRREWLTNTPAWTAPWGDMIHLAPEVLDKQFILLGLDNKVVGLESLRTLLDRYRPLWAEGQPLLTAHP